MTALMLILSWVIGALIGGMFGSGKGLGFLGFLANVALSTLLSMGFTAVMLHSHDALESVTIGELWHPKPFWKFLGAQFLVGLVVLVGLLLLIVPGVVAALAFMFVLYLVIDKELGPIKAMKESVRITRGNRLQLLLLALLVFVLNIVGLVALLVGLFVSIPVTTLAIVHAYRVLRQQKVSV